MTDAAAPGYVLLQITVHDAAAYRDYETAQTRQTITDFGGTVLAIDDDVEVLEGGWAHRRTVILRFPSAQLARQWHASPDYQRAAAIRRGAAESNAVIVDGLPQR